MSNPSNQWQTPAQAAAAIDAARQVAIQRWNAQLSAQQQAQRAAAQRQAQANLIQGVFTVSNPSRPRYFQAVDGRWYYASH